MACSVRAGELQMAAGRGGLEGGQVITARQIHKRPREGVGVELKYSIYLHSMSRINNHNISNCYFSYNTEFEFCAWVVSPCLILIGLVLRRRKKNRYKNSYKIAKKKCNFSPAQVLKNYNYCKTYVTIFFIKKKKIPNKNLILKNVSKPESSNKFYFSPQNCSVFCRT